MLIRKSQIVKSVFSIEKKYGDKWNALRLSVPNNYEDAVKTFESQCEMNLKPETNPLRLMSTITYVDKVQGTE